MIRLTIACLAILLTIGGAQSQVSGRVYRLGVLALNPQSVERVQALTVPELARRGFVEGQNLIVDSRVGDVGQLPGLVQDLLAFGPDAILAINSTAVAAVQARTRTLPIIMFGG